LTIAAATLVKAAWGTIGFRTPPKENTIAAFALNTPDVKVTVNMLLSMEATPAAPEAGDVNETVVPAPQLGDPDRVTTRMDPDEKGIDGTNNMDMVTFDDPATTEDRVIVGESCRMIEPDGTLSDGNTSAEVITEMPNGEFDCGEPIIMPEMVRMVASVPVAFPAVVRTKCDDDIKLLVEFR
jgi:hypothetical protein